MQGTPWRQVQGALCKMLELTRGQGNIRWEIKILILNPQSISSIGKNISMNHSLCALSCAIRVDQFDDMLRHFITLYVTMFHN